MTNDEKELCINILKAVNADLKAYKNGCWDNNFKGVHSHIKKNIDNVIKILKEKNK